MSAPARGIKIRIRGLMKSFGPLNVLSGVNLSIRRGETIVIIGGSGSGKSVLLKHTLGLLRPDAGTVEVDEIMVSSLKEREMGPVRSKFGFLFQGAALFDSMTVSENVSFGLVEEGKMAPEDIERRVENCLRMVGLRGIGRKMPADLSGGMKKRVGLARAIAHKPEVILYDEPTTGLDPIMADVINDLIIKLRGELGVTSVAVTHDMVSAYKIADRLAMLYDGKIRDVGTPEEIRSSPDPVIQQFINGKAEGPIQVAGE